jgi:methylenetetrahydrofolate dehydrogenase (NADP+)/methenyltetrahydrofolate cyclohydrolase
MTARIIDGRAIAASIRQQISKDVKKLQQHYHIVPTVVTVKVGYNPSSELYLKLRNKACAEVGITTKTIELSEDTSEKKILQELQTLNTRSDIHGILVQFPIPKHIHPTTVMNAIHPMKDVEGFHPSNMGQLVNGNEYLIPCTPLSVLTILEHEHVLLEGKNIAIVNHSAVVGKPLTLLFLNRNATVSVCHVFTKDIIPFTSQADILVTATGIPHMITPAHVKKGATVIDVGITATKDGVCGDVDFESVKEKASAITPVPGGVGPVTIACSLCNMIKTFTTCMTTHK